MRAGEKERGGGEKIQKGQINGETKRNASKLEIVDEGGKKSCETEEEEFTWRWWRKGGGILRKETEDKFSEAE